jgi:hypothetical protein
VHNISTWTVFPSFLIFIENMISIRPPPSEPFPSLSLPYVRLQKIANQANGLFCVRLSAGHGHYVRWSEGTSQPPQTCVRLLATFASFAVNHSLPHRLSLAAEIESGRPSLQS